MINNLESIKPLLSFDQNQTYQVMVIVRKKEQLIPENHQSARIIRYYYISNLEYLENKYEEMCKLAEVMNARVYINLNGKDISKIGNQINYLSALYLKDGNDGGWKEIYETAFKDLPTIKPKRWVIDVDTKEGRDEKLFYEELIKTIYHCDPVGNKIIANIETPNGYHLITNPFNHHQFCTNQSLCYDVDIKKDMQPTLIYYSQSLADAKIKNN